MYVCARQEGRSAFEKYSNYSPTLELPAETPGETRESRNNKKDIIRYTVPRLASDTKIQERLFGLLMQATNADSSQSSIQVPVA